MALETTIKVSKDTRQKLKKMKEEDEETYDSVIRRELNFDDDSPDDFSATVEPVVAES